MSFLCLFNRKLKHIVTKRKENNCKTYFYNLKSRSHSINDNSISKLNFVVMTLDVVSKGEKEKFIGKQ